MDKGYNGRCVFGLGGKRRFLRFPRNRPGPIEKLLEGGSSKAQKEVNRKSNEKNKGKEKSKTKIQGK